MQYGILTFKEPKPNYSKKILHVDMDAFYASVEVRDNPKLRDKPVVIARHPRLTGGRGIVATCNYKAREYGIHSAMSAQEALNRCPKAIFIPGRHDYYRQVSNQIREMIFSYTDLVEPVALDEAYLDVTHNKKKAPSATLLAQEIQAEIYQKLKLTCSIGVSYNKFIAKLASDFKKPHGITLVDPSQAHEFLMQLAIEDFHGVGKKSVPHFHELGIKNGYDLYQWDLKTLEYHFGKMGHSLYFKVRGIYDAPVNPQRERKSLGKETTFGQFLRQEGEIQRALEKLTRQVSDRLIELNVKATTVTLKVRYEDFQTLSRQIQLKQAFNDYETCWETVWDLWMEHGQLEKSVRLLGVSVSNFQDSAYEWLELDLE
ncbi:DNA polymerase IV [Hutsoniella sourekii]